jgi:hypothetical protein
VGCVKDFSVVVVQAVVVVDAADVGVGLGFAVGFDDVDVDLHGGSESPHGVGEADGLGLPVGLGFDAGSVKAAADGSPVVENWPDDVVGLGVRERDREPDCVPDPAGFCVHGSMFGFGMDTVTVSVPSGPRLVTAVDGVAPEICHGSVTPGPMIVIVVV